MPKVVEARSGDTLCTLAIANGFLNCDPLRGDGANAALLKELEKRPLQKGDKVTIPDIKKNKHDKGTDKKHPFKRKGVPPPSLRFVDDQKKPKYQDDRTIDDFLNVSNYVCNKTGADGLKAFPTAYGHNADAAHDPDSFKIEAVDPGASADEIEVELMALKPVYKADGSIEKHEPFTDADAAKRKLKVKCKKLDAKLKGYRSRYLRLVTDEADLKELSGDPIKADGTAQGLFTSDMADGTEAKDACEILDQAVQAKYVIQGCKASDKCTLYATLPVGNPANEKRIRLCFHVFRSTVGGAPVGGMTDKILRRRTFKWYRRSFAQAEMAPKLVDPKIEYIDPPAADMIVISDVHGSPAAGGSTMSFILGDPPSAGAIAGAAALGALGGGAVGAAAGAGIGHAAGGDAAKGAAIGAAVGAVAGGVAAAIIAASMKDEVKVTLSSGQTPLEIARAIIAALPKEYKGHAYPNPTAFDKAVNNPGSGDSHGSVDLIISRNDGKRIIIRKETTDDANATISVVRLDLASVEDDTPDPAFALGSPDMRRVIRAAPGTDDRMDCYIIDEFKGHSLRGIAFMLMLDLPDDYRPRAPLRWACIMACNTTSGPVMDASDNLPFTYPHESGHVMFETFHTAKDNPVGVNPLGATELMTGVGTSESNAVDASKRICDTPLKIWYACFEPHTPPAAPPPVGKTGWYHDSAVARLRTISGPVTENWS
ncbi:MAG: hypothetical protein KF912_03350 [Phycisphaeraceae bacterium]|nr:hypothetical protein [Phycisphaeraceae bacterium]QYK48791.1 MAG: hypothetical protein KF838_02820 [Phycisphaeraceae bacterium]